MIRKLAHICLTTDRLEEMAEFYTKKLGFSVKFIFRNEEEKVFGYYVSCGDTTFIEIFDRVLKHKKWGGELLPLTWGNQIGHMCFEVTDLRGLKKTLEGRGVKLGEIHTGMDLSLQAWTNDPDGNAIELMEYTHASWQLQPAKTV